MHGPMNIKHTGNVFTSLICCARFEVLAALLIMYSGLLGYDAVLVGL